jgi:diacylglycerol kinase (ATP)
LKPYLIVNPASAGGTTGRHFDRIARAVRGALGAFECAFTRQRGEGVELARAAVRQGGRLVVAVGGDGTASEVIDGLVGAEPPCDSQVLFGCIPRGTGSDFRRSLGWPTDPDQAARALASGVVRVCDVGRIEFLGHDGRVQTRHFANVAGLGISGVVTREIDKGWKILGGRFGYMLASARGLISWSDQPVRYRIDQGAWQEERLTALEVCNGRYFGSGMMVAPQARVDDGLFDIVIWKGLGLKDFLVRRSMIYDGTHVRLPNTRTTRAQVVEAEPLQGAEVLLDVDGEQPGKLPARFSILPGALRLRVPGG